MGLKGSGKSADGLMTIQIPMGIPDDDESMRLADALVGGIPERILQQLKMVRSDPPNHSDTISCSDSKIELSGDLQFAGAAAAGVGIDDAEV
jgi:hypothetical protein